jgi:UDP-2,3-diacylglucosamine pyrophosphatase LpxH
MKYGIISDTHRAPQYVPILANALKSNGVDALVLNGDLGESIQHIAFTIMSAAKTGLPVYVQPGSHEEAADYITVMHEVAKQHPNVIDCLKNPKIEHNDHHAVFLPGSDWTSGGDFYLRAKQETGIYVRAVNGLRKATEIEAVVYAQHPNARRALSSITRIDDLDNLVTDAERTVVFCHIPARFNGIGNCVDMAYFAENERGVVPAAALNEMMRARGITSPIGAAQKAQEMGYESKRENRGNEYLGAAYQRNGVTKIVTGHFHESAHRAHTMEGKDVAQAQLYKSLAFMASYADQGKAGIITVKDDKMAYERLFLSK